MSNDGEDIGACAEEGGPKIIEEFARIMQNLTAPINMFRGIGGKLNGLISTVPALQGVLYANTAGGTIAKVFKSVRVLNERPSGPGVVRDFIDDGTGKLNLTSEGLKNNFENGIGALKSLTRFIPGRLQQAEEDAARRNFSDEEKDAFWTIANQSDRLQREVEAIEDREGIHTGERDPQEAIKRDPDFGSTVVGSGCRLGYREFPLEDGKTSTCVFESLVEDNCYKGSRPPSDVDLGESGACLYYSRDFIQPNGKCRDNYEKVHFQGLLTCRWADLGPEQVYSYTLHKGLDDEQTTGDERPQDNEQTERPEEPETGNNLCQLIHNAFNDPVYADIPLDQKKAACRTGWCSPGNAGCGCCDTLGSAQPRSGVVTIDGIEIPSSSCVSGYTSGRATYRIPEERESCLRRIRREVELYCGTLIFARTYECLGSSEEKEKRAQCRQHFEAQRSKCG